MFNMFRGIALTMGKCRLNSIENRGKEYWAHNWEESSDFFPQSYLYLFWCYLNFCSVWVICLVTSKLCQCFMDILPVRMSLHLLCGGYIPGYIAVSMLYGHSTSTYVFTFVMCGLYAWLHRCVNALWTFYQHVCLYICSVCVICLVTSLCQCFMDILPDVCLYICYVWVIYLVTSLCQCFMDILPVSMSLYLFCVGYNTWLHRCVNALWTFYQYVCLYICYVWVICLVTSLCQCFMDILPVRMSLHLLCVCYMPGYIAVSMLYGHSTSTYVFTFVCFMHVS